MDSLERTHLEKLAGKGKIYINHKPSAAVRYDLDIVQEYIEYKSHKILGDKSVSGLIAVVEGERDIIPGRRLVTLKARDRREFIVYAAIGDAFTGKYFIKVIRMEDAV